MAAEKLTRARLAQILVIFIILISAFAWRTFNHKTNITEPVICQIGHECTFKLLDKNSVINFGITKNNTLSIQSYPIDNKKKQPTKSNLNLKVEPLNKGINISSDKPNSWIVSGIDLSKESKWKIVDNQGNQVQVKLEAQK
ncbi:MAG: hypothetical protein ACK5NC_04830 [Vibrio sp.]